VAAPIDAEFELLDYEEKRQCVSVLRAGFLMSDSEIQFNGSSGWTD
jgi:hypothetical protein